MGQHCSSNTIYRAQRNHFPQLAQTSDRQPSGNGDAVSCKLPTRGQRRSCFWTQFCKAKIFHLTTATKCNSNECLHGCMINGKCNCQHPWSGEKCDFDVCSRCDPDTEVCSKLSSSCDCKHFFSRGNDTKCHVDCKICESEKHHKCNTDLNTCGCAAKYKLEDDECVADPNLCTEDNHYIYDADQKTCTCAVGYDTIEDDSCVVDCEGTCSGEAYSCDKVSNTCNCTKLFKKDHAGACKVDCDNKCSGHEYSCDAKENTCDCAKGLAMNADGICQDPCNPTCDRTLEHCLDGECNCKNGYERITEDSKCTKARELSMEESIH
ncbi:multiple epidermal growth factor-like domains protein 10 [Watersipora subatra]|uniref:multiple epidermal growth factor-like domains protein 10 n=1 Tax=Watersipora subatra TaxID=2589382 RepID=UPI00355C9C4D